MAFKMDGEFELPASCEAVWEGLNSPEILKLCIPGCQELARTGENGFSAIVKMKIGPVAATFRGAVQLNDLDPPNGYRIEGQGDGGTAGFARGGATVTLTALSETSTLLRYAVDAVIGGRLAQLGGRLVNGVAMKLADEFFAKFAAQFAVGASPVAAAAELAMAEDDLVAARLVPIPALEPAEFAARPAMSRGAVFMMMAAIVAAELTCSLESGMIYAALSELYKQYGNPIGVGWLLTAFTLTSVASAAVAGRLGDLFGRQRVMLVMLAVALTGSLLSAVSSDLTIIIVGRAIQGASMAILPLGFGILRESLPARSLGFGISIIGATYTVGGGIGVVLGGVIVDNFSWHGIFFASAALAFVSIGLVGAFVPDIRRKILPSRIDWLGGLMFAPAVALALYGLSEGLGRQWSASVVVMLVAGLVLLAVWFRHEWRHADPLIDVRQLRRREVGLANLVVASIALGPLLGPAIVLPFLQQPVWTGVGFGVAATMAGLIKLPANAVATISSLACGALSRNVSVRSIMMVSAIGSALGWFGMALGHDNFWFVVAMITLLIVPTGSVILVMTPQIIVQTVPEDRTSEATGLTQVIRAFAKAIGTQIIALSFASSMVATPQGGGYPAESAYILVFTICGGLSLLCLALVLALPADVRSVGSANKAPG